MTEAHPSIGCTLKNFSSSIPTTSAAVSWKLVTTSSFQIDHNSSVSATDKTELLVFDLVLPLMQTAISGFIGTVLVVGLIWLDPVATIAAAAGFAIVYILVTLATARRLADNSKVVDSVYDERLKVLQESLGGIRDVIIDQSQAAHLSAFASANERLDRARATTIFIASAPRFIVEALGMVIIAAIVVLLSNRPGGISVALLGAFGLGAATLPLVQTVYAGWSMAAGRRSIVGQVVDM